MSKNRKLWLILDLIFVIVFNALFFIISGFDHKAAVWIAYVFIHVAYALLLITPFFIERGSTQNATDVPIYSFSGILFLVSFVINIILIAVKIESVKVVFVVNILLIAIYAYLLVSNMIANNKTASDMKHQSLEAFFVKSASESLRIILGQVDEPTKGQIERVYDKVSASQTKSAPEVAGIEQDITDLIGQLGDAVDGNDADKIEQITKTISRKVDERNSRLRIIG